MEQEAREIILRELPQLITQDPQIRDWVWHLIHDYAPSRAETESRFDQMLAELKQMREEHQRRWEENQRELSALREEHQRRWEENQRQLRALREEQERRWQEQQKRWEEQQKRWEEQQKRWEENQRELRALREEQERRWQEQQKRWEENQRRLDAMIEAIQKVDHRIDRTIGALGARWGTSTEKAFRDALAGILSESFGVTVERVEYEDESGEVFGHPDQVELDVIIRDGEVLVCEIKSSVSRGDVYIFERKVRSYEKRLGRKVNRLLLISPVIREKDQELAKSLGMEVYADADEVTP